MHDRQGGTETARRLAVALGVAAVLASVPAHAAQRVAACGPGAPDGPRLLVTVQGARRVAGNITFTVYGQDRALFLKHHGWLALARVPLATTSAAACFAVSAPGDYAVAVYHDENDNQKLDTNLLGIPVEGYGFSNNAPTSLGPPAFASVRMTVHAGDNPVAIRLRY